MRQRQVRAPASLLGEFSWLPAAKTQEPDPKVVWDAEITAILRSVSEPSGRIAVPTACLDVTSEEGTVVVGDDVWPSTRMHSLVGADRWWTRSTNEGSQAFEFSLNGDRVALVAGMRLARRRPGVESDRADGLAHCGRPGNDYLLSNGTWIRALRRSIAPIGWFQTIFPYS